MPHTISRIFYNHKKFVLMYKAQRQSRQFHTLTRQKERSNSNQIKRTARSTQSFLELRRVSSLRLGNPRDYKEPAKGHGRFFRHSKGRIVERAPRSTTFRTVHFRLWAFSLVESLRESAGTITLDHGDRSNESRTATSRYYGGSLHRVDYFEPDRTKFYAIVRRCIFQQLVPVLSGKWTCRYEAG